MFVYLDESGDTGFKFDRGSSRYFVVTLLLVDDPIPFHAAVAALRARLGFAEGNEFKWYKSSEETRWAFLRMLRKQDFAARVLVIDKTLITAPHMRKGETFYNELIQLVLRHDDGSITDATVILDESVKSKQRKQGLTTYLRKALNVDPGRQRIKEVKYHASHTDNIVQATDMLAGAVNARYKRDRGDYLDYIKPKIIDLWVWRPNTPEAR